MDSLSADVERADFAGNKVKAEFDTIIYFPQIGHLIAVSLVPRTGRPLYKGAGDAKSVWERKFSTEERAYFKSNEMREMDEHFGDVPGMICGIQVALDIPRTLAAA
ncbi:MAG: MutS protein msh5 [Thelocarpon impressellum]|nr:MAG: MutS protein msh5 [Thelocarpon impressellum]